MEALENRKTVSHRSHRPWKSLRDSHIPTAANTITNFEIYRKEPQQAASPSRLILALENAGPPDHYRPPFHGGLLRVSAFGATRPLKNLMSAAGAALTISRFFGGDLELWINSGRDEGAGCIVRAIEEMFRITRHAHLARAGWASWHDHRKTVARMNLLINCSYTESFNMVTADGVAEGIPSVVSDAICWAPGYWRAPVDDVLEIACVGRHLLCDPLAPGDGYRALLAHNADGLVAWKAFLAT